MLVCLYIQYIFTRWWQSREIILCELCGDKCQIAKYSLMWKISNIWMGILHRASQIFIATERKCFRLFNTHCLRWEIEKFYSSQWDCEIARLWRVSCGFPHKFCGRIIEFYFYLKITISKCNFTKFSVISYFKSTWYIRMKYLCYVAIERSDLSLRNLWKDQVKRFMAQNRSKLLRKQLCYSSLY